MLEKSLKILSVILVFGLLTGRIIIARGIDNTDMELLKIGTALNLYLLIPCLFTLSLLEHDS